MDMIRGKQQLERTNAFLAKTINLLGKNVGEYICDSGICRGFQEKTQRTKYKRKSGYIEFHQK